MMKCNFAAKITKRVESPQPLGDLCDFVAKCSNFNYISQFLKPYE